MKVKAHCNCPESSEAIGLPVGKKAWTIDQHKMTQTETIRKNNCKYCGNYVYWKPVKKGEKNEDFRN